MPWLAQAPLVAAGPDVARAIDIAARRWPGEPRSRLLVRLVAAGSAALEEGAEQAARARREAINASSGKYPGAFVVGYLADLRRDWPE